MKSAKIKHDYFVYPILRMGTIFFRKRRSRANEHLKNAHLQQLLNLVLKDKVIDRRGEKFGVHGEEG